MGIFGLGAFYQEEGDMTQVFLSNGVGCVGWSYQDAPGLHRLIRHVKVGDILYIKAQPATKGLIIKAVGIVLDDEVHPVDNVGEACIRVRWIWNGYEVVGRVHGKYNVRNNTLYEETHPEVQNRVIDLLLSRING